MQVAGFAVYCVGKTLDQIRGIAIGEKGAAEDADILATTTIGIGDFAEVVALAVENAAEHGAEAGDALYIAMLGDMHSSKSATENKDGTVQLDCSYTAVTMRGDTVSSIIIDGVQPKAAVSAEGKVTSDTTAKVQSKLEKGDAYGMKAASKLEKGEWYQQMEGFCAYVTGRTLAEVAGIAVSEDGKATDADVLATTTISIREFQELIGKIGK